MKVVRWTSYDGADGLREVFGGMGGIPEQLTRAEYLAGVDASVRPYAEAIWAALDTMETPPTGEMHQAAFTPVFDDDTCARFTYRSWGDLVSAWWNDKHPDEKCTYVDFYM